MGIRVSRRQFRPIHTLDMATHNRHPTLLAILPYACTTCKPFIRVEIPSALCLIIRPFPTLFELSFTLPFTGACCSFYQVTRESWVLQLCNVQLPQGERMLPLAMWRMRVRGQMQGRCTPSSQTTNMGTRSTASYDGFPSWHVTLKGERQVPW